MLQADGSFCRPHPGDALQPLCRAANGSGPILCLAAGEALKSRRKPPAICCPLPALWNASIPTPLFTTICRPWMTTILRGANRPTTPSLAKPGPSSPETACLTWAFDLLSDPEQAHSAPKQRLKIIHLVARAAGPLGMVGGQALDIASAKIPNFLFKPCRPSTAARPGP